jgi:hypothetical protein
VEYLFGLKKSIAGFFDVVFCGNQGFNYLLTYQKLNVRHQSHLFGDAANHLELKVSKSRNVDISEKIVLKEKICICRINKAILKCQRPLLKRKLKEHT